MNQGQIVGPAMLLNIVMRWPRASPMVALCVYTAAAYAGDKPVPEAVNSFVEAVQPMLNLIASL